LYFQVLKMFVLEILLIFRNTFERQEMSAKERYHEVLNFNTDTLL